MIVILLILIVVIVIGVVIVMLTTGKTNITTITLEDLKKGLKSGLPTSGVCNKGMELINNECRSKLINSDCPEFQIPDPDTKFTTCKKLNEEEKKAKCKSQGKVLYNDKCLVQIDQKFCTAKGSYLKPDPATNNTSCTEMDSDDIKNICTDSQVFFDGECKQKLTEKNCSKKLFMVPDPKKNNTECKKLDPHEINEECRKIGKNYRNGACHTKVTPLSCKLSNWKHSKEKLFYQVVDENSNYTKCRKPNVEEKFKICSDNGFSYNEDNDKCGCPNNAGLREGKCISVKTQEICFPMKTANSNSANFKKPDPSDPLSCINMNEKDKKDYCDNLNVLKKEDDKKCI